MNFIFEIKFNSQNEHQIPLITIIVGQERYKSWQFIILIILKISYTNYWNQWKYFYNTLQQGQSNRIKAASLYQSVMSLPSGSLVSKLFYIYTIIIIIIVSIILANGQQQSSSLYKINQETHQLLHELIQTKYFRILRVNLNRQCELWVRNKICKSNSCTVCRCDQKDIPTNWIKTDKVQNGFGGKDLWQTERNKTISWIWHVQDEQNDQGEYFDLYNNVESYTNYDGSPIWKLVYEENCFNLTRTSKPDTICKEQAIFYKVVSGLHTSISTHLSMLHKNITQQSWNTLKAKQQKDEYFVNYDQYKRRVLNHPERVHNLLFLYQIYLRAIKQVSHYLIHNYTINTQNIVEDLQTAQILKNLSKKLQSHEFKPFDAQLGTFFHPQNPKVQLYQKYFHNISRLMNCVECEKCRLFGKMQTYGIGTALKILLGYNAFYKRNQIVALFNAWNKISMSVNFYYQTVGAPQIEAKYNWQPLRIFTLVFGVMIVVCFLLQWRTINWQKSNQRIEHNLCQQKDINQQKPQKNKRE